MIEPSYVAVEHSRDAETRSRDLRPGLETRSTATSSISVERLYPERPAQSQRQAFYRVLGAVCEPPPQVAQVPRGAPTVAVMRIHLGRQAEIDKCNARAADAYGQPSAPLQEDP
jgi:hypothetical protein